jgi:hypothetical protein
MYFISSFNTKADMQCLQNSKVNLLTYDAILTSGLKNWPQSLAGCCVNKLISFFLREKDQNLLVYAWQ